MDELKAQIMARDETINKLERELKRKTEQYHGVLHDISHSGEMVDSVRCKFYFLKVFKLFKRSNQTVPLFQVQLW